MNNFRITTDIFFGTGSLEKLEEIDNKKILIICDSFINSSGIINKVKERLTKCKVEIFNQITPDPTVEVVALGVQILKKSKADVIIAVGGGSSIDGAKAIKEYYTNLFENDKKILFYAIPTTSGTGSEVTEYAVITNKEEKLKYALANKSLLPDIAILDSELVKSVPKSITADTGMDVITHAIEAYISTKSNDFTDALAEKSLSLAFEYLYEAYIDGENGVAREKMHNASCLAGMAFNSAGLGITHSLAHAIGGKFHIPHGKANAIILPYVIKFNSDLDEKIVIREYSHTAKKLQKISKALNITGTTTLVIVNNLIKSIFELQKKLSIPRNLLELGLCSEEIEKVREEIIDAVLDDICTKTNPKKVDKEKLNELLDEIIGKK